MFPGHTDPAGLGNILREAVTQGHRSQLQDPKQTYWKHLRS